MIYGIYVHELRSRLVLPAVWVHTAERLTEYFDGIKSKGVCAWCGEKETDEVTTDDYKTLALTSESLENHKTTRNQDRLYEACIFKHGLNVRND